MQDLDTIKGQVVHEEATLASTQAEIDAAHREIEEAERQIEATKLRILGTQKHIEQLQQRAAAFKKRISLLRQYLDMLEADAAAPAAGNASRPAENDQLHVVKSGRVVQRRPSTNSALRAAVTQSGAKVYRKASGIELPLGADIEETGEIPFVDPPRQIDSFDESEDAHASVTFDEMKEDYFTHEILPRTQTFDEELILLMAYHKKAIKLRDVVRTFRRLDYTPKLIVDKAIQAHIEGNMHLFEYVGDRIALTHEGREEAERLLREYS